MLGYIKSVAAIWARMIAGPLLVILDLIGRALGWSLDLTLGKWVLDLPLAGALALVPLAQYRLWRADLALYADSDLPKKGQPGWIGGCEWATVPPSIVLTLRHASSTRPVPGPVCIVRHIRTGKELRPMVLAESTSGSHARAAYGSPLGDDFELRRYSAVLTNAPERGAVLASGKYEVRWNEVVELGEFRLLVDPYMFEIRNGVVTGCGDDRGRSAA